MMEFRVELGDGALLKLPQALQWKLSYGTGVPCDSFYLRCIWEGGVDSRMSSAALFYASEGDIRLFTGVVDEYAFLCSAQGLCLELSGRSMAARLLDNEAMPAQYQRLTCTDLVERHVSPYGLEVVGGEKLPAVSGFSVSSGVSEWSVVQDFACYHGGIMPRFDKLGRLVLKGYEDGQPVEITDSTPVTHWEFREQRYGVLSSVAVRRRTDWGVQWVEDPAFLAQGGCARRVIAVPNETGDAAMRYSADYQLKASQSERVRLTLSVAGALFPEPGQLVKLGKEEFGGAVYRLVQTEVEWDEEGVSTLLVLGEPGAMI